jgi:hypothetical protein
MISNPPEKRTLTLEKSLLQRMTALAVALTFMACNRPDTGSTAVEPGKAPVSEPGGLAPADRAAFEKEAIEIKARFPEDDGFAAAMHDLMARYRLPMPALPVTSEGPMNGVGLPGKGGLDEAGEAAGGEALAKSAANVYLWKSVKEFNISYPYAVVGSREVAANKNLGIFTTTANQDLSVDAVLVAFYRTSGTDAAYKIKVVGYDDDSNGGRDALILWTNNTGATQVVEFVTFAYNKYTTGPIQVGHYINGVNVQWVEGAISATRTTANLAVDATNCNGPLRSRLRLRRLSGGGYGTGLLAINVAGGRGGIIKDTPLSTTLDLGEKLTVGGGNFVMAFLPNVTGDVFGANKYYGYQEDQYFCAQ